MKILYLGMVLFLSSCVTILGKKNSVIYVHINKNTHVIMPKANQEEEICIITDNISQYSYDSAYSKTFCILAANNAQDIPVTIANGTKINTIYIKPIRNWLYYLNIYPGYCLGLLVDAHNPARFVYPKNIYIDTSKNNHRGYYTHIPYRFDVN